jgi:single-stranded-DNA-specific exonuclease
MSSHKILNIASANPSLQDIFSQELGISKITAQLLLNRGVQNIPEAQEFLDAKLEYLLDPFSFSEMRLAIDFIKKSVKNKERVMVYGDYDVDGISSLVLLKSTLSKIGADVIHYIPHRIKEGYGLNQTIVKTAKEKKVKLVITADCGTNSLGPIRELRRQRIEVIVTDHHEPGSSDTANYASAVINPKFPTSGYKYRDLAGVGVAYKLCQAVSGESLDEDLDLVSLGTIADSVPLTGENRIVAKEGLARISRSERLGLKTLIETSGIKDKKISPDCVSFILGPRINASGRLDTAETALNLLMSQEVQEAQMLAKIMETHNRQRQKIESEILKEAQELINKEINFKEHKVMVVAKKGWHLGVLGIVAAKLADRFYRPAILISLNDGLCRGSGRSIKNFHLFNGLLECRQLLDNFGGHQHAIGMVIPVNNIEEFKNKINNFAERSLRLEDLIPSLDIDMVLGLSDLNKEFIRELEKLEPFGAGNPEPLFYTRNLRLKGQPHLFSNETLKFWVTDGELTYPAIGFGMGNLKESLVVADGFDLVYTPRIDTWMGEESLLLEVKEIFLK